MGNFNFLKRKFSFLNSEVLSKEKVKFKGVFKILSLLFFSAFLFSSQLFAYSYTWQSWKDNTNSAGLLNWNHDVVNINDLDPYFAYDFNCYHSNKCDDGNTYGQGMGVWPFVLSSNGNKLYRPFATFWANYTIEGNDRLTISFSSDAYSRLSVNKEVRFGSPDGSTVGYLILIGKNNRKFIRYTKRDAIYYQEGTEFSFDFSSDIRNFARSNDILSAQFVFFTYARNYDDRYYADHLYIDRPEAPNGTGCLWQWNPPIPNPGGNEPPPKPKKDLRVLVDWQTRVRGTNNITSIPCSTPGLSTKINVKDDGSLVDSRTTGCGFTVSSLEEPDADQDRYSINPDDYEEVSKTTSPDGTTITFLNEKIIDPKKDVNINVEWWQLDTATGKKTQLQCSGLNYETSVTVYDSMKSLSAEDTCKGFTAQIQGNLDAMQRIQTPMFKEDEVIKGDDEITFKNLIEVSSARQVNVEIKWFETDLATGKRSPLSCNRENIESMLNITDSSKSVKRDTTCEGFGASVVGVFDASQTNLPSGFKETDKSYEGDDLIIFENERYLSKDARVSVEWYDVDSVTGEKKRLDCGSFSTSITVSDGNNNLSPKNTCEGFPVTVTGTLSAIQSINTPEFYEFEVDDRNPNEIIFKNERKVTNTKEVNVEVKWFEYNNKTKKIRELDCGNGNFTTWISVSGNSATPTCEGFTTMASADFSDATTIQDPSRMTNGFVEMHKTMHGDSTVYIENERSVNPKDVEVVVEWYEADSTTNERKKLDCRENDLTATVTVYDDGVESDEQHVCDGFTTSVLGSFTAQEVISPENSDFTMVDVKEYPNKIVFENERGVTSEPVRNVEVIVRWFEVDKALDNQRSELYCKNNSFRTNVTIKGGEDSDEIIKEDSVCDSLRATMSGKLDAEQEIDISNSEFVQDEKYVYDDSIVFFNQREIDTSEEIEIVVEWWEVDKYSGKRTKFICEEGEPETGVVVKSGNYRYDLEFTYEGFKQKIKPGRLDASESIVQNGNPCNKGFREADEKKINESSRVVFVNEKIVDKSTDYEVAVEWYDKNAVSGERTKLECGSYSTSINVSSAVEKNPQNTCAGFKVKVSDANPTVTQSIADPKFTQFDVKVEAGKTTFYNERVFNPAEDYEVIVEWYNENKLTKELTKLECGSYSTKITVQEASEKSSQDTCGGFTVKTKDANPTVTQAISPASINDGFTQMGEPEKGNRKITFKNKKEFIPEEDFDVEVEWYEEGEDGTLEKIPCDNFSTTISLEDESGVKSKETCSGFKIPIVGGFKKTPEQHIKNPPNEPEFTEFDKDTSNPKKIIFKNKRPRAKSNMVVVDVKWQIKDLDSGSVTELTNCKEFSNNIKIDPIDFQTNNPCALTMEVPDYKSAKVSQEVDTKDANSAAFVNLKDETVITYDDDAKKTFITFINQKESRARRDLKVVINWEEDRDGVVAPLLCKDYTTEVNVASPNLTETVKGGCTFDRANVGDNPTAVQDISKLPEGFTQKSSITTTESTEDVITTIVTITNIKGKSDKKDLQVFVKWKTQQSDGSITDDASCDGKTSFINIYSAGVIDEQASATVECQSPVIKDLINPDAVQTKGSLNPDTYTEIEEDKTVDNSDPKKTVITFTNLKREERNRKVNVEIEWYIQEEGKLPEKQACDDPSLSTEIVLTDGKTGKNIKQIANCNFSIENFGLEPKASQTLPILGGEYDQNSTDVKYNYDGSEVTFYFKNLKFIPLPKTVDVEVRVVYQTLKHGKIIPDSCANYIKNVIVEPGSDNAYKKELNCNFILQNLDNYVDVAQFEWPSGYTQIDKQITDVGNKRTITFVNQRTITSKDLEVILLWQMRYLGNPEKNRPDEVIPLQCDDYSAMVNIMSLGTTIESRPVTCSYNKVDLEEPNAILGVLPEGFSNINTEVKATKDKTTIIYTNEAIYVPKPKINVTVDWWITERGKESVKQDCQNYTTEVTVSDTNETYTDTKMLPTGCGFTLDGFTPNPTASQKIISEGFEQNKKEIFHKDDDKDGEITFHFINEKVIDNKVPMEIKVIWQDLDEDGNITILDCAKDKTLKTKIYTTSMGDLDDTQETCSGFTNKLLTDPNAYQEILVDDFKQIKQDMSYVDDKLVITFTNQRERDLNVEVAVNVIWQLKEGDKLETLNCNDYNTMITLKGDNSEVKKSTACGFPANNEAPVKMRNPIGEQDKALVESQGFAWIGTLENNDDPKRKVITFINQKEVAEKQSLEVKVEWWIQEGSSSPVEFNCANYKAKFNPIFDNKLQEVKDNISCSFSMSDIDADVKNIEVNEDLTGTGFSPYIANPLGAKSITKEGSKTTIIFRNLKKINAQPKKTLKVEIEWWSIELDDDGNEYKVNHPCTPNQDLSKEDELISYVTTKNGGTIRLNQQKTSCGFTDPNYTEPYAEQISIMGGYKQTSRTVTSDNLTTTIKFVNTKDAIPNTKTLQVELQWWVQSSIYRPAKLVTCGGSGYESKVKVTDKGLVVDLKNMTCGDSYGNVIEPDAEQIQIISDNFKEKSKITHKYSNMTKIIFVNQKCMSGQEPDDPKDDCKVEPLPPYFPTVGVVNPKYPSKTNWPDPVLPVDPAVPGGSLYPGKPGKPTPGSTNHNPIFIPPSPENEVPTQVSGKAFDTVFVDPNIKFRRVPNKDWPYEVEYTNPYTRECYKDKTGCKPPLPFDGDTDFQKWINGNFYVYLIDAMVNPDYIKLCQSQGSDKEGDMELKTTIPYYYSSAKDPADKKAAMPYKGYEVKLSIPSLNLGEVKNPQSVMPGIKIRDAHQKLTFMVKYSPAKGNLNASEHNICNVDTFALRPAYFTNKISGASANIGIEGNFNNPLINIPRITSSAKSNLDIQRSIFFPSDSKEDNGGSAYGVPNYVFSFGFYKNSPDNKKKTLINIVDDVVEADVSKDPFIRAKALSCDYKKDAICIQGLCNGISQMSARSAPLPTARKSSSRVAAGRLRHANLNKTENTTLNQANLRTSRLSAGRLAAQNAAKNANPVVTQASLKQSRSASNAKIWDDIPMLIEASFGYYDKNGKDIGNDAVHKKIKDIRQGLSYYTENNPKAKDPTSKYDQGFEGRSLISTHAKGNDKLFLYNNVGDMEINIIDSIWTSYDQALKDAVGRTRAAKCVVGSLSNARDANGFLGCNAGMEGGKTVAFTFVPDYIEVNPLTLQDRISKNNKVFTYFANKAGKAESEDMTKEMFATYKLDATAYVSDEIYPKIANPRVGKDRPLIAYGYENVGTSTCGKNVNYVLDFNYDCGNSAYKDKKISSAFGKRCAPDTKDKEYCKAYPLDSRCHVSQDFKKVLVEDLKKALVIFDPHNGKDGSYNLLLKDFANGVSQSSDVHFNFKRSVNYPTNPKVINVNDFSAKDILQVGFKDSKSLKDFIRSKDTNPDEQVNEFLPLGDDKAIENNAHFYYGYVNSVARSYLLDDKSKDNNNVKVNILVYASSVLCNDKATQALCNGKFLDIFKKENYIQERSMYRNIYDNYSGKGGDITSSMDSFAREYKSTLKWGKPEDFYKPSFEEDKTVQGVQNIEFKSIPSNFAEDIEEVYTAPYFVYSDRRDFISDKINYNVFRLIYHPDQGNTWGGEGSSKQKDSSGKLDKVGNVPMDKNLKDTSKNLNRRLRW